jgi:hypothetical protein
MRRTFALVFAVLCAPACDSNVGPSLPPPTRESFATSLAGTYALTIRLDDRCSSLAKALWDYRAVLSNAGSYLSVQVMGNGYSEPTIVAQIYPFADSTARFIWNFTYPETPVTATQLLLYGSSDIPVKNGALAGAIAGDASTTRDGNTRCSGPHAFTFLPLTRESLNIGPANFAGFRALQVREGR